MRRLAATAAVLVACSLAGAPAHAATRSEKAIIDVFPGANAIHDALAIANAGDTLNIHAGTYGEQLTVSIEDLTLRGAGDGTVIVDGTCSAADTIQVKGDGVTIQGLRVIGAGTGFAPKEIDFIGVTSGRVLDSEVEDTCGNAEYGVNVFNGGSIRVLRTSATGFSDAGIYIGQITSTQFGPLVISDNDTYGNVRGIIVENSAGGRSWSAATRSTTTRRTGSGSPTATASASSATRCSTTRSPASSSTRSRTATWSGRTWPKGRDSTSPTTAATATVSCSTPTAPASATSAADP